MLQDAAVIEAVFNEAFAEELLWMTENAFINGTGSGQPLGFMNSGALVTVAKEGGQTADTIVTMNILNMWDRLPVRSRANAVWLVADSLVETQLFQLTMPNSNVNIYFPPGNNAATPQSAVFGTLLGRPVIPVEYMAGLGDVGDIALVDLNSYIRIDKGGTQTSESMHVRFIYDEMCYDSLVCVPP